MVDRLGPIPGVIGFQLDNEIGVVTLTNPQIVERFRDWVVERLGGVDGVNDKWGLTYWSHRISRSSDLWAPDGNTNPGYALEWQRFQRSLTHEFLMWQRDLVRPRIRPDQIILHDQVGGYSNRSTATLEIAADLDRTAVNIYVPFQDALTLPEMSSAEISPFSPNWANDAGTWAATWRADMAWALRGPAGEPFGVTEAQAGSIGGPEKNVPPYPGQLRLFAHLLLSRGADLLAYWHWHSLHYGFETYWGGVLGHDLRPNRLLAEVSQLGAELRALPSQLDGLVPDADIAMLYSVDSMKALGEMPPLAQPSSSDPDRQSYHRVFRRFYQAASDTGAQVRIVHERSDWSDHRVLIVPVMYIADDETLDRLREHARSGAHVILTFRTGYADQWAQVRSAVQPARLAEALGAEYQEFMNIIHTVPLTGSDGWDQRTTGHAEGWADLLVPDGAQTLLAYDHPFLRDYAAVVTQPQGAGRLTWVGTLPDRETTTELIRWALQERGISTATQAWHAPESLRISSATLTNGARAWFVGHHGWGEERVPLPLGLTLNDAVTGDPVAAEFTLGPWESRILVEPAATH